MIQGTLFYRFFVNKSLKGDDKLITADVVQFNEKHKWCGCLGIVTETKEYINDIRYMVGVPMPEKGTAYIFSMESANELEYIGRAVLTEANEDEW